MRGYLLDTHIWLWYLTGNDRLPASLRHRLDSPSHPLWLSPISLWEAALLAERGRFDPLIELRLWMRVALERLPAQAVPLSFEIVLRSRELSLPHPDPADHFLAATALVHDLVLATVDRRLTAAEWLPTISD